MASSEVYPTHYAYPLVTWRATILGAVVALVTALMLNLLGASLGIAALQFVPASGGGAGASIVGIGWIVISNLLALGFGAWIAGRTTANPDHHGGTLQGIAVWAVTSLAVLYIASSSLNGMAMHADEMVAAQAAQAQAEGGPSGGAQASAPGAQNLQGQADRASAAVDQNPSAVQHIANITAAASFSLFLAMLLGLISSIVGARIGARHPTWEDRPRFTIVDRKHAI